MGQLVLHVTIVVHLLRKKVFIWHTAILSLLFVRKVIMGVHLVTHGVNLCLLFSAGLQAINQLIGNDRLAKNLFLLIAFNLYLHLSQNFRLRSHLHNRVVL